MPHRHAAAEPETRRMDDLHTSTEIILAQTAGLAIPSTRKALLVVGMSRSGTSLTAHALNALGAALPDQVLGPSLGNPLGHWEPTELVVLNEHILDQIDRPIDDSRPIDPAWFRSMDAYDCVRQIADTIERIYTGERLFVIKDPRLCRLLPLYLEALDILDIEPLVLLQVRSPSEVSCSLVNRDRLDPSHARLLWLRSVLEAELYSRRCRRIWVSFDGMIRDWYDTVDRIAHAFDIHWPFDPDAAGPLVDRIVKPRQRHSWDGAAGATAGHPLVAQAWDAATLGLRGNDAAARAS
jgi:hypothetical protein